MATTVAPGGVPAAPGAPAAPSLSPSKAPAASAALNPPPPPGGPATACLFRAITDIRAFLTAEAAAEGWSAGAVGGGELGADDAAPADPAARRARPGRPPPDWDWVAGQLLPLLQQYSGEMDRERERACACGTERPSCSLKKKLDLLS